MKNPEWLRTAVTYQVLIDRFFRGRQQGQEGDTASEEAPVFCGGNLHGVAEKLDYLVDLGVNAIWLSPFTQGPSEPTAYHGYHATDLLTVDPRFGGLEGLRILVEAARSRGIRLIMDFVANHVHREHPWFQKALANDPRYRPWFCWQPNGDYLKFLDVAELPKLNLDNRETRDEVINAAKHWLDQGIDGLRLDHALGPSLDFWLEFRRALKRHKPEVALIGEVYFRGVKRGHLATIRVPNKRLYFLAQQVGFDVSAGTMREYVDVFDGLLDFEFQNLLKIHVARKKHPTPEYEIQEMLDRHYASFPGDCALLSFLDNHDMNRFLFEARGDKARLSKAVEIQFAQSSPPVIYYGTEAGLGQNGPVRGDYGDLRARRLMAWEHQDRELLELYQKAISEWKRRSLR